MKRYDILGIFRIIISLIYTKLFFRNARLIRWPFDIRNKKFISLGKNFTTGFGCRLEAIPLSNSSKYLIEIGDNVQINDYVHIGAVESVRIGNNVLLASKIYISDHNHGSYIDQNSDSPLIPPNERKIIGRPVIIDDNVWIGESACILPGVSIGKGSIVGALSVVTKSVPDYCIVAGVPAKIIKVYNFEEQKWVSVK